MNQQLNLEERIKPFKYMAGSYCLAFLVRILTSRRHRSSIVLKSPLLDFIPPLLIGTWIFSQQNMHSYHEYERYSLKRIQNEK